MNKFTAMVLAAVLAGLFCAHPASAQNITIISGNGQLVRPYQFFSPMTVRVTDSNGAALPNTTVNWTIASFGSYGATLSSSGTATGTTTTDGTGTTSNVLYYYVYESGRYLPYTVTASTNNASASFFLTASENVPNSLSPTVTAGSRGDLLVSLLAGQPLTGQAGSTFNKPLQVFVGDAQGAGVSNVSVQLVNLSATAVVNCQGAAGGEANTVLTDPSGLATCNPVFGLYPGSGQFYVLVGAGGLPQSDPTNPVGFWDTPYLSLSIATAQPGLIQKTQGDGQSALPGHTLFSPLQVEVDAAAGSGSPVAGQSVTWTASPVGAISFSNSTTTQTGANGQTSQTVTFSSTASGTVVVTATCPACPATARSVTFTLTVTSPITLTALSIISGNNQTAPVNTTFGLPLVVQVNASNGQPAPSGIAVQFSVSGPASLSSGVVNTNSSGQAQVTVQAGATTGPVTVMVSASGLLPLSFTLTVMPLAPTLTASAFFNGADFQAGSISPCSIATIIAPGLAPGIQGVVTPGSLFGPLPYLLASDSVSFNGIQAPMFNVANVGGQQQITVQVPCEVVPSSSVAVTVTVNGVATTVNVPVLAASPGVFQTAMSDGVSRAVLVRPDGSFVSLANPARRGEIVRAYATGLGVTSPSVGTNATAIPGTDAIVQGIVILGITNTAGQGEGVRVSSARVAPDLIGVFEVPFTVPMDAVAGNNTAFSVGVYPVGGSAPVYSVTAKIPIQ